VASEKSFGPNRNPNKWEVIAMNGQERRSLVSWVIVALAAACILGGFLSSAYAHTEKPDAKLLLRQAMRRLWAEHAIWTRQYIVASIAGSPDAPEAANRLLRNQEDIGYAIAPFYGIEAGKRLTGLLKAHVLIGLEVVEAAKSDDQTKLKEADERWHAGADDLAAFLSNANSYWPKKDIRGLWYRHLSLTTEQATARLQKNWKEDIAAFDRDFDQMMAMADGLAEGIIKQFSARFY
jgi:hypothetical protein